MYKKTFLRIHLWLSFPVGIIISIICISGAILVFDDELDELLNHKRYFVKEQKNEIIELEKLLPIINSQLEGNTVASIRIPSDPKRNYMVGFSEGLRTTGYVDPYTGELIEITKFGDNFSGKIMHLHRWLLDSSRKIGKPITGYSTLLFVIILISGLILWYPKSRKQLGARTSIKTKKGIKRFLADLHISGGFYLSLGLIILALTGLTYSFRWYNTGFYKLLGVEMVARESGGNREREEKKQEKEETANFSSWNIVFEEIKAKNPDYKTISLQKGSASVTQNQVWGNCRATDKYSFDNKTGKITEFNSYQSQDKATKVRGWIYSIHTGAWGGIFSKILTALIAFIGGLLPFSGYYIYFKKRKKKK